MSIWDMFRSSKIKAENEKLQVTIEELQSKLDGLDAMNYYEVQEKIKKFNTEISTLETNKSDLINKVETLQMEEDKLGKSVSTQSRKVARIKELYKSVDYAINNFFNSELSTNAYKIPDNDLTDLEATAPSVILKLHAMDIKDLRKAYNENNKQTDKVLSEYASRYTTKGNKAIYQLMVIALRAELQNILYNLKYENGRRHKVLCIYSGYSRNYICTISKYPILGKFTWCYCT